MAYQRRSPQNRISAVPLKLIVPSRKKYSLRRSPHSRRQTATPPTSHASHAFSAASHDIRPVLVPLHPNLRRLPSRLLLDYKDSEMRSVSGGVQVGVKRKRVASTNENARTGGRPARGSGRLKRMRSVSGKPQVYTSDEDGSSSMEVDTPAQWSASDQSDLGEQTEDEDSTDDYLINYAEARQLQRLKKDELVRLYGLAGLSDDAEAMTKVEIIDTIISARDDIASLPPSSPPNRGDGNSSDYYSSDDGNTAGGEETDIGVGRHAPNGLASLRRRATINDMGKTNGRPFKGRSLSLGQFNHEPSLLLRKNVARISTEGSRRRSSNRSSPTTSKVVSPISPPATRLRSRKVSASTDPTSPTSKTSSKTSSRGKGKQVEFQDDEPTKSRTPPKKGAKGKEREKEKQQERAHLAEESDLTELEELEESLNAITPKKGQPSPRRLRSKDRGQGCSEPTRRKAELAQLEEEWETIKRVTPMRKAKVNMKNMKESEDEDEGEDEELDELDKDTEELEVEGEMSQEDELEESVEGDGDVAEEDEVDELVSTASTPPPRRTPLKNRLRSRRRLSEANEPSDGDDEGEDEEEEEDVELEDVEEGDEDAEGEEDIELGDEEEDEDEDEDEETVAVSPRTLRNGKKIVSERTEMEVEEEAIEEEVGGADAEDPVDDETLDGNSDSVDDDAEGDTDDETMEDDVDLTVATAKTLVRLRRDDLVRLCETRDLEPIGTKPQLAEALLEWRNRQANEFSSPSSAGTARPPSTVRRKNKRAQSRGETLTPILLRSEHVHQDEPRTPPVKEVEPELELDLESLGLEDREIPPEKLQKLEKIGSGGFKDVYIGKLKGRRIAISEFRGQLSAMDIKELKLLGGFDHPNIVRFLGVSIPENTRETPVMIISELCSNGDLFDYVRNVNPPTLYKVMSIMLDIACGLEYLHTRKPSVIHRDCKSSNILITSRGTAKIADFGLAKVKQSTRSMVRSLVGTVNWQAPELWHAHPKYNHKVDVFSCAMVYWEMLQWHLPNKKFPWEGMNEHAIYDLVGAKRQRPSITGLRKQWSPELVDLIERMWAHEHQDRPTISEVVETLKDLVARR